MAENPQSAPQEIPQEAVAKFHALTPEQQQTAIGRMTPELKQKFLPAALEYKAMHAPDSAYQRPMPPAPQPQNTMARGIDALAGFTTRNAPTIAGAVGGVLGSRGGIPGAVAGATAGGAVGGAIRSKAETGSISGKEVAKSGAEQGTLELAGGLAGKGILKTAKLLGVDDALLKFALKRGEDFERDLNPAAALNKYQLKSLSTKELFQKTSQTIGSLTRTADAMLDQVAPYSSTVRPFAVIKGVLDRYMSEANKVSNASVKDAIKDMIEGVAQEFNAGGAASARGAAQRELGQTVAAARSGAVQGGTPVGAMMMQNAERGRIAVLPTDRIMTTAEANQLKRSWGESVTWGKEAPKDALEAAYKTVQNARRDIYHALNDSIADAMGGNQGKYWRSTNHDIFNLMEAKGALQEAGERTHADAVGLAPRLLDAMRKPGLASTAAAGARNLPANLADPGVISNLGRAGSIGTQAAVQNPIPTTP